MLKLDSETAGLVIRKDEDHFEAQTKNVGPKILKVCTLKVRDEFRGEKFGELLLKQILWFAQQNSYDLVYLTVFPKHAILIDLLSRHGFEQTKRAPNGELFFEKTITKGASPEVISNPLEYDRQHYPRFFDGSSVQKFVVPIQPDYHRRLFPEIAFAVKLPLFPNERLVPAFPVGKIERQAIQSVRSICAERKRDG